MLFQLAPRVLTMGWLSADRNEVNESFVRYAMRQVLLACQLLPPRFRDRPPDEREQD